MKKILKNYYNEANKFCITQLTDNIKRKYIFNEKYKSFFECFYSLGLPICKCQIKCIRDMKRIFKYLLASCSHFKYNVTILNQYKNRRQTISYLKDTKVYNKLGLEWFLDYKNELAFINGYKGVLDDFCYEKIMYTYFTCFMYTFRDKCREKADCYKVTEHLKLIDCSTRKFAQAFVLIKDIWRRFKV